MHFQAKSFLGELEKLKEEEDEEESDEIPPTKFQIVKKAVILLIAGTLLAAVFADPLVDAVSEFSTASQIPSFFISFFTEINGNPNPPLPVTRDRRRRGRRIRRRIRRGGASSFLRQEKASEKP